MSVTPVLLPVAVGDALPESPRWWLAQCEADIEARRNSIERARRYYDGDHPLAFATTKFREAFSGLFEELADNWCPLIVDSAVERLVVEGFRFEGDTEADRAAWSVWQANSLDSESVIAHTEAVKTGQACVLVSPRPGGPPRVTVEDPLQATVLFAEGSRTERAAALKTYTQLDGRRRAVVFLPDRIYFYEGPKVEGAPVPGAVSAVGRWEPAGFERNPLGVVPMIPLRNLPDIGGRGASELEPVFPLNDAVNKLVDDMIVASEYAAYPQRVLIGAELPPPASTGETTRPEVEAALSRLWTFKNQDAKVEEFSAADLKNYREAIEMIVQHIAAQTRTPPHYMMGQIVNASADALKSAEAGLVAKVRRKAVDFGEVWEEAMRLALRLNGAGDRASVAAETIWRDPEFRTEGEKVDALVKMETLGVPREALWEKWGATPQEIARWKQMADEEALRATVGMFTGAPGEQGAPPELNPPPANLPPTAPPPPAAGAG